MLKRTYLRLVEMQEEQARQHLEEVRSIHNEMRGYKHDFHHHLQALKGQLEAGQVDRAIAYLEQLDRSLQTVDTLVLADRSAHELAEQRLRVGRTALELGMSLGGHIPRMYVARQLDHLD